MQHFRYAKPFHLPSRRSPEYVILICWQGRIEIVEDGRIRHLSQGEMMISNPDLQRQTAYLPCAPGSSPALAEPECCEGWALMISRFQMSSLVRETGVMDGGHSPRFFGKSPAGHLSDATRRALEIAQQQRPGTDSYLHSWLHQFAMEVLWTWPSEGVHASRLHPCEALPRSTFIRAVEFMQQSRKDTFGVEELGRFLGMSPPMMRRRMHASTGRAPLQLFNDVLAQRARGLLATPSSSVKEVAYDLGFSSVSQFSHFFRRMTATTPTAFQDEIVRLRAGRLG
ncbi:MAG: AraC family transcriptional regulator [Bryobacterales bacterium]|nr:AraC family transcriptional regulator [Bryobacterales bacterium]